MNQYSSIFKIFIACASFMFSINISFANNIGGSDKLSFLTDLRSRGFSLLPAPQEVELGKEDVVIDGLWSVRSKVRKEDIAVRRLTEGASELHNLTFTSGSPKEIVLSVRAGTVKGTNDPELNAQGYLLHVTPERIEITGNDYSGLFYGVQSFLQLLRRDSFGRLIVPECVIRDWPSLELRFVHWDTKHHQKRMETMKRLIDWHVFFKVNMIAFEIEDKYEYPRHPVIGAPGAYTQAEMQELTRYAGERHIQLVPDVQAPAHMSYVLKHEQFAHLRSDSSNYQICMCDPEAIDLIFDMCQDMIDATPGVDYFLVSTDEVYYAGICDKCQAPYNDENRSLAWAEFAKKAHDWLAERGRRMIAWVEYPLLPEHVSKLPPDLINGVFGKTYLEEMKKIGMRQLAYSYVQGEELLFPNYFPTLYRGHEIEGCLQNIANSPRQSLSSGADLIGNFTAAWDDAGLHEETFQLGWSIGAQYGWNPYGATVEQTTADFVDIFYGQESPDLFMVYKLLEGGARFFENGWDRVESKERGPAYGNHLGKGIETGREDLILSMPDIPSEGKLGIVSQFNNRYSERIAAAKQMKIKNDELLNHLTRYIAQMERNRYNLEVFLSIAYLERYFIQTLLVLSDAENLMLQASDAASGDNPAEAVAKLIEASNNVSDLLVWGEWMWQNVEKTWEKSRYEKNRSVGGKEFVYVMDDVKDHFADRRKGLDYMIAPFQRMDMAGWHAQLNERIKQYAADHRIPIDELKY